MSGVHQVPSVKGWPGDVPCLDVLDFPADFIEPPGSLWSISSLLFTCILVSHVCGNLGRFRRTSTSAVGIWKTLERARDCTQALSLTHDLEAHLQHHGSQLVMSEGDPSMSPGTHTKI
jgi:hypothetical protein